VGRTSRRLARSENKAQLKATRGAPDNEEQVLFDQGMASARAAMEGACLEPAPGREESACFAREEGILASR
jgi:hypothetical protein